MKISLLSLLLSFCIPLLAFPQIAPGVYLIELTDKNNSPYSLNQPEEFLSQRAIQRRMEQGIAIQINDLPVNAVYLDSISSLGAKILVRSKWFNSIAAEIPSTEVLDQISALSFVRKVSKKATSLNNPVYDKYDIPEKIISGDLEKGIYVTTGSVLDYGYNWHQISLLNGNVLHDLGYMGEGKVIAVLDAGFYRADEMIAFDSLRNDQRILGIKDFVEFDDSVYNDHYHGSYVLSLIASYNPGLFVGTAPKASFYLIETENVEYEYPVEEENWIAGIEYADSVGADIVTSSVSYLFFDDTSLNHTLDEYNGNTTRITRAADMAASKGMLVFNSAGNQGVNPVWPYITFPGDADSIMTVGAVDSTGTYYPGSSINTDDFRLVKPNVVAIGREVYILNSNNQIIQSTGTSYSTPQIAGLAACLWQANPEKNNYEILQAIEMSASQYNNPDRFVGYGIPDFAKANILLSDRPVEKPYSFEVIFYPNPATMKIKVEVLDEHISDLTISIIDIMGKIHYSSYHKLLDKSYQHFHIDNLNQLEAGMYFVKIESGNESFSGKLLIEK